MFDKASVESMLGSLLEHREDRDLSIDFKQDAKILQTRLRLAGTEELAVIRKFIEDSKAKGRIRESKSECVLPVLLVKKLGSSIRVYVDYRAVNEITIKNRYPLPYIRETIVRISQAKFFTVLDIITAFNRLRIKKGNKQKTAFTTRYGTYEYLVILFGLSNILA